MIFPVNHPFLFLRANMKKSFVLTIRMQSGLPSAGKRFPTAAGFGGVVCAVTQ
ncbi:hypothetical protein [Aggregatibacter kilianii]|uniref:hypothetical protein n=1 Tax=Aggregatibacter kilianii TaxID=2025884 RepID=UPI0013A66CE6|nr:hypothetical protein [Aggregatibacter kilianii]